MEQKKYSIIYADPPWRYEMKKGQGVAENHFSTMGIEEICSLPVQEICDKNCVLFLWVTFPQLSEAFRVIKEWGFQYKTVAFVWIKLNRSGKGYFFGLGYWDSFQCGNLSFGSKEENRKEYQEKYFSLFSVLCRNTAKNRQKPGNVLWS